MIHDQILVLVLFTGRRKERMSEKMTGTTDVQYTKSRMETYHLSHGFRPVLAHFQLVLLFLHLAKAPVHFVRPSDIRVTS
jgi:hypothetical protein